jgi:hypothetical protein
MVGAIYLNRLALSLGLRWLCGLQRLELGVRLRSGRLYQQPDLLPPVRQEARRDLLARATSTMP